MDSVKQQRAENLVLACGAIAHIAKLCQREAQSMLERQAVAGIDKVIDEAARLLQHNVNMILRLQKEK